LIKNPAAMGCLVDELRKLRPRIAAPKIDPRDSPQLVRITGALRTVLVNDSVGALEEFRRLDDLDVISVLAFAARGDDQSARINATRILSDVVDNNTICVILDHLYDPELGSSDSGASGRVNLLGVTSVLAPWAYQENYQNIRRLVDYMRRQVSGAGDFATSVRVLDNIEERLRFQDSLKNKYKDGQLPSNLRDCVGYKPLWAGSNLSY